MKEQINRLYHLLSTVMIVILLQACGGSSDNTEAVTYSISADTNEISFSHEILQASEEEIKIEVTFDGNGLLIGFAPDATPNAFFKYRTENVTSNSATVFVSLNGTGNLAPTSISTTLRLSTGDVDQVNLAHHDIDLSVLIWQLTTDQSSLSFKGTFGDESIAAQTIAITSADNEWTASVDVDWLTLENAAGTGDGEISVIPDISAFIESGLSTATITLSEVTSGDTKSIPVELGLDNVYLFTNQEVLTFLNSSNSQTLTATLNVGTNHADPVTWQATSEADWLTLTTNGDTSELTVDVDVNKLPEGDWFITEVSLAASNNERIIGKTIPVTIYNTANELSNQALTSISMNTGALASAATQPHVYIGSENKLDVYHKYTHELLASHTIAPEGTLLEQFILHPTESHMLAKAVESQTDDQGNVTVITHRYRILLSDFSVETLDNITIEFEPIRYVSIAGRHFIITELLELADEDLTLQFWDTDNAFFTTLVDIAQNTGAIYALDLTNSTFNRFVANVNDFTTESIDITLTQEYRPELLDESSAVRNFVIDDTEQNIYAISPTSEWINFDGSNYADNGLLEQAEGSTTLDVQISTDNKAHYIRFNSTDGFVVDIYDSEQNLLSSSATEGAQPTDSLLTKDNRQLILYSAPTQRLEFIAL